MPVHLLFAILLSVDSSYCECLSGCLCEPLQDPVTSFQIANFYTVDIQNKDNVTSITCNLTGNSRSVSVPLIAGDEYVGKLLVVEAKVVSIGQDFQKYGTNLTQVTLKNCQLTTISSDAFNFPNNIQMVDLSHNEISNLTFLAQGQVNRLLMLMLENNNITSLRAETFRRLENLQVLALSSNAITSISSLTASPLNNLKVLQLKSNRLSELPKRFFPRGDNLSLLDFSYNRITQISKEAFQGLVQLTYVNLDHNLLSSLPPSVFSACVTPNLESLHLAYNLLTSFSYGECGSGRTKLRELWLDSNRLTELDADLRTSFSTLTSLRKLHLENNSISNIPSKCFAGLSNIGVIHLNMNPITSMAGDSFTRLTRLDSIKFLNNTKPMTLDFTSTQSLTAMVELVLRKSQVKHVEVPFLHAFPNLQTLDFKENLLTHADFFTTTHKKLKVVNLSRNQIQQIEDIFADRLPALEWLDLSDNRIHNLDLSSFQGSPSLTFLDFSYNHLTKVSAAKVLRENVLEKLQYLNLSNNDITEIRYIQNIHLASLAEINLSTNKLQTLPDCLFADAHITNSLRTVDYSHNDISCDCDNAWLREINEKVEDVMPSRCKGYGYLSNTFPVTKCAPHEVHRLNKVKCSPASRKPSVALLIVFGMANLFLFALIGGGYLKKRLCHRQGIEQQVSRPSVSSAKKNARSLRRQRALSAAKMRQKLASDAKYEGTIDGARNNSRLSSIVLYSAERGSLVENTSRTTQVGLRQATSKKTVRPGKAKSIKLADDPQHADLIKKLLIMEQADHDVYPMTPKSVHASYEYLPNEVDHHQVFLNLMKKSQSADNLHTSYTEAEEDQSQIIKVYNAQTQSVKSLGSRPSSPKTESVDKMSLNSAFEVNSKNVLSAIHEHHHQDGSSEQEDKSSKMASK